MNTWKPDLEATKRHYTDWWEHRGGTIVSMWEHFQQGVQPHADIAAPPPPTSLSQKWFDPQWRARYLDWYVAHSSLKADMLPVANTQLGPGSLAAILGAQYEGGEDTIWIHPACRFDPAIPFNPSHPNYLLHKELLKACKRQAQGHYYVGMPDLMEGLDVLAALKGTDQVLLDTVMHPELVERQMQRINDVYFQVFDELYDIIREGDEMAFCYFSSWAPGKMTKLQSDISTMISDDDYRRFVQPYIRQQCQQIPYTLYHLDGVGAIRHLPALLDIDELNAIQWTPGVGQPQGGNAKWYGLYQQILDAGKGVMCCWVTLDELPALLDNIGTDGVHLEMDFHNEDEVEQALEIVATRGRRTRRPPVSRPPLAQVAHERILVLDGAMGTMIQQTLPGFKGVSDLLCISQPQVVGAIHNKYLEAGADLIETCTFNAQRISMSDQDTTVSIRDINLAACRIARQAANHYSRLTPQKPRYVVGSIGPTARTITATSDAAVPLAPTELYDAYLEQASALIDGGVDALLIETIFDVENARQAIVAASKAMELAGRRLPIMLSFSVNTVEGRNMLGQSIPEFIASLDCPDIFSVGINCHGDVTYISPLLERLAKDTPYRISFYPNAGHPDSQGRYAKTAEALQAELWPLAEHHCLNIVGGCCGTSDSHIAKMAEMVQPLPHLFLSPHSPQPVATALQSAPTVSEGSASSNPSPAPTVSGTSAAGGLPPVPASLKSAIMEGRADQAASLTQQLLAQGATPQQLVDGQMTAAMAELGRRFEQGQAFVPQLLMASRAMKAALQATKDAQPNAAATPTTKEKGVVVIGTVKGDLHDIGKNLVASMLEGSGFRVINIGIDVAAQQFVEAVRENKPDLLCMSALLTTTMGYMKEVIEALEAAGLRQHLKIMIGGAPTNPQFAREIGADGYSDNANSAVAMARQLLQG